MLLSSLRQALEGCAAGASGGSAAVVGARRLAPGVQPRLPQPTPKGLGGPVHAEVHEAPLQSRSESECSGAPQQILVPLRHPPEHLEAVRVRPGSRYSVGGEVGLGYVENKAYMAEDFFAQRPIGRGWPNFRAGGGPLAERVWPRSLR